MSGTTPDCSGTAAEPRSGTAPEPAPEACRNLLRNLLRNLFQGPRGSAPRRTWPEDPKTKAVGEALVTRMDIMTMMRTNQNISEKQS